MRVILNMLVILFFSATTLCADTIIMRDKRIIKGLVVDEYVDSIVLSTVDGEKDIFRRDIENIEYDLPEQNFVQLGKACDAKGWHDKAADYYKKALDLNPDYHEARNAYHASYTKMWHKKEKTVKKEIEYRNIVRDWWENKEKPGSLTARDEVALLKKTLGLSLLERDGFFVVDEVMPFSSAKRAEIDKGDILVGIWGKVVSYANMEDVIGELLGPKYSEVNILLEKQISVPIRDNDDNLYKELGVLLEFEYEGLVIRDVTVGKRGESAGFKKADFVTAIDGNVTRYLPLASVIALINRTRNNKNIIFSIRRNVNLRRQ
ncbi:MAG: hypothetical protein KJ957_04480 [Candidatus Omnitrophica bacterium]|nr:hypothetical protein [Candidatus Omnitrophota bacterium]